VASVDCSGCDGYCCRNHRVTLCALDLRRLKDATGLTPSEFITLESVDDMRSMFADLLVDGRYYYLTLKRFGNGKCIFAGEKEERVFCLIYENRPLSCRLYPFKLTFDGRTVKRNEDNCPALFDKGKIKENIRILQEAINQEIRGFEEEAHVWNKEGGGTLEECFKRLTR
jgi:Fe-S-cluster containining protein